MNKNNSYSNIKKFLQEEDNKMEAGTTLDISEIESGNKKE